MTGNEKKMCRKTSSKINGAFPGVAISMVLLLVSALAIAEEGGAVVTHLFDTSTDRIPFVTAFPKYPSVARRDRIEGEATVCFKIKTNGKISRPSMRNSSHKIFVRPTLRAIKKSTFEPLGPNQILATAKTCRTYRFRLEPIAVKAEPNLQQ
jgi:TonB family protein